MPKTEDPLKHALEWDWGTAYEFLLSLDTVFRPKAHGVPAPWAAGVRKRLSPQGQAGFKAFFSPPHGALAFTPLHLVLEMDQPKDVARFLNYIEAIPDEDFCRRAHIPLVGDAEATKVVGKAFDGKKLTGAEIEEFRKAIGRARLLLAPSLAETRVLLKSAGYPLA